MWPPDDKGDPDGPAPPFSTADLSWGRIAGCLLVESLPLSCP